MYTDFRVTRRGVSLFFLHKRNPEGPQNESQRMGHTICGLYMAMEMERKQTMG